METFDEGADALTAKESWQAIHTTMDDARSSMYAAGSAAILLLWSVIASVGFLSQYAMETLATDLAERRPWFPAPLWGGLAAAGMVGSALIGHRAGRSMAAGAAIRSAGIRVFLFWLSVVVAAFLIPGVAGMWNEADAEIIPRVTVGIVVLGYILFGVMVRPLIAVVGAGIAAAFYIPSYLAGDSAPAVSAAATLAMVALAYAWIRKSGEW